MARANVSTATLPERHPDPLIAEFDDAYVVFDPRCGEIHLIDALSAVVFNACDGSDRAALADDIASILGIDRAKAETAIDNNLTAFARAGLLVGTNPSIRPP